VKNFALPKEPFPIEIVAVDTGTVSANYRLIYRWKYDS
jgi:hypothetical protein